MSGTIPIKLPANNAAIHLPAITGTAQGIWLVRILSDDDERVVSTGETRTLQDGAAYPEVQRQKLEDKTITIFVES